MSALFLLLIPPLAVAAFRVLASVGVSRAPAVAAASAVALALTVVPAYALRTKPSQGEPNFNPYGPALVGTARRDVELLVDFGNGWSGPVEEGARTVRRLTGRGQIVVGPLQATRPRATLRFDAWAARPSRLVARLEGRTLATARVGATLTRVAFAVPAGDGPAVLELEVVPPGVVTVALGTIQAVVRDA